MLDLKTRGKRIAQTRRLWAVVLGEDVPQARAGSFVGVSGATWSRWESDDDTPRRASLEAIAAQSRELGLPGVTAGWLDYAEGEGLPIIGHAPEVKRRKASTDEPESVLLPRRKPARKKRA